MVDLNTIFYDKTKKTIVRRMEKKVDTGEKKGVMLIEKTIVHGTDKDTRLMTNLEQYQKKIAQMKETLKRKRGEGQSLKRKHEDMLSKIEKSK